MLRVKFTVEILPRSCKSTYFVEYLVRELDFFLSKEGTRKRSDKEVLYNIQPTVDRQLPGTFWLLEQSVDRMDSVVGTVKGTPYPLNSKRLRLQHLQHLARALDLPAAAPRSDLEVMIGGRITELRGEGAQAQVVISLTEEGEQLSLRDEEEAFLVTPPIPPLSSKASTPSQENYDSEKDTGSLSNGMTQLHIVLSRMEEEKTALKVELNSVKVEFDHVKAVDY